MDYCNTEIELCQDDDVRLESEIKSKFVPKRLASVVLAQSYKRLEFGAKCQRVQDCGTWLEFRRGLTVPDGWKLSSANFCRDRLCPMCSWRRTYKIFGQVSQIMDLIGNDYVFLFLTLTVPNCKAVNLIDVIDNLDYSWSKLSHYTRFKKTVCGFFKALEITRNLRFNTYHPHYHVILAVKKSYFGKDYINHDEWLEMWRKATKNPSITQVDIRKCKAKSDIEKGEEFVKSLSSAVAEVAKYSVKSADYLGRYDKSGKLVKPFYNSVIDDAVFWLSGALKGRRLCAFGGCFDEARKKLALDDCEDGDLIHIDGTDLRSDVAFMVRRYKWTAGVYKLTEEIIERPDVTLLGEEVKI